LIVEGGGLVKYTGISEEKKTGKEKKKKDESS